MPGAEAPPGCRWVPFPPVVDAVLPTEVSTALPQIGTQLLLSKGLTEQVLQLQLSGLSGGGLGTVGFSPGRQLLWDTLTKPPCDTRLWIGLAVSAATRVVLASAAIH